LADDFGDLTIGPDEGTGSARIDVGGITILLTDVDASTLSASDFSICLKGGCRRVSRRQPLQYGSAALAAIAERRIDVL
jgi:hypothetical protein